VYEFPEFPPVLADRIAIVRFCSSSRIRRSSLTISWTISSFKKLTSLSRNTITFTADTSIVLVALGGPVSHSSG
jgi:hypothetical protein